MAFVVKVREGLAGVYRGATADSDEDGDACRVVQKGENGTRRRIVAHQRS